MANVFDNLGCKTPTQPACQAGKGTADTYFLAVRCPVYRGRDSNLGFRTELENLLGDARGKDTSGRPMRPKVPSTARGALLRSSDEAG